MYRMKVVSIGINQYSNPAWNLNGCMPDLMMIQQAIAPKYTKYNLDANSHRMLADNRATDAGIVQRLKWAVSGLMDGGLALIHYSGHGSQVADRNNDEVDGKDEILCPYNMSFDRGYISDDTIAEIFSQANPNAKIVFIADCCHSGTIARDIGNPHPPPYKSRFIQPPADIAFRTIANPQMSVRKLANGNSNAKCISISGCRDDQTSADAYFYDRRSYHGALSWALAKTLNRADRGITYRELVKQAIHHIKEYGFGQDPQLSGPADWLDEPFLSCADVP